MRKLLIKILFILSLFSFLFLPKKIEAVTALNKNVLVVIFNPLLESYGNKRVIEYFNWNNPDYLNQIYIDAMRQVSGGIVNYRIVDTLRDIDMYPEKSPGVVYTDETYLKVMRGEIPHFNPDVTLYEYQKIFERLDLCTKVKTKNIDEIWLWGGPWFGFYEAVAVGRNAPPMNGGPLREIDCGRVVAVMGFNYERGGPMLEDFVHRSEGTLGNTLPGQIWRAFSNQTFSYSRNCQDNNNVVNQVSGCGWAHYPPNGKCDYDWTNTTNVTSNCDDWVNYPNLTGATKTMNCSAWSCSNCEQTQNSQSTCPEGQKYMKWWLSHIPRNEGKTNGIYNNWWLYLVDYENTMFQAANITPSLTPSPTPSSTPTNPPATCQCSSGNSLKSQGDANCDGAVNRNDLSNWINQFASHSIVPNSSADFNCNNVVDRTDLSIWINGFSNPNIPH